MQTVEIFEAAPAWWVLVIGGVRVGDFASRLAAEARCRRLGWSVPL
jgi:hypothetical protein